MLRKEDERDRNKERERKKKRKRKYGQAKLKHSKRGIMSCAIAGSAGVLLTGTLVSAFITQGTAAPIIGGLGIVAMILAGVACVVGIKGLKEREKNYLTCKIGIGAGALLILGFVALFFRGLF